METTVRTNLIVSGLPDNFVDWDKVDDYACQMIENDINTGHNGFPPIKGFFGEIELAHIENNLMWDTGNIDTCEMITKKDIGTRVFFVTDGHHRAFAAQRAGIWSLDVEKDISKFIYQE